MKVKGEKNVSAAAVYKKNVQKVGNGKNKKKKQGAAGAQRGAGDSLNSVHLPAVKKTALKNGAQIVPIAEQSKAIAKKPSKFKQLKSKLLHKGGKVLPKSDAPIASTSKARTAMPAELMADDDSRHYGNKRRLMDMQLEPLPAYLFDSREHGKRAFKWLLYPMEPEQFFR